MEHMLLKPQDVAKLLNVSTRTVHRMSRDGSLDYVTVGKHSRYPIDQFARYVGEDVINAIKQRVLTLQNPPPKSAEAAEAEFLGG